MASTAIVMPKMSMTMTEGEVVEILIAVGDEITSGQLVAVVGTDKTDMEVESDHAGKVLEVLAKPGDVLEVGAPMFMLETQGEDLLAGLFGSAPEAVEPAPAATEVSTVAASSQAPVEESVISEVPAVPEPAKPILAMPGARRQARDQGIDLANVQAASPSGVIKQSDLAVSRGSAQAIEPNRELKARALIAKVVATSLEIPQFSLSKKVSISKPLPKDFETRASLLLQAWQKTIAASPKLNTRFVDGSFVSNSEVRAAYLVETSLGFVSPVISLAGDFAITVGSILAAASTNKISLENLSGATTSVTDLSEFDVLQANTLLFGSQTSGLNLGKALEQEQAVTIDVTIVLDHRIVDPGDGARALGLFEKFLNEVLDG
ncbi:biotin/lipoyl-containing protein [Aquiluna sp. Uisw_065]|uniref:biotin/lipoyl-containing protein n=1 Tax=Aquiluna sp. Uisw_065 TaxID=3230967 RepID=UPI0039ED3978